MNWKTCAEVKDSVSKQKRGKQPASIAVTVAVLPVWKKYDIADRKCIHLPLDRWILFIKYKADEEYKIQGT